MSSGQWEIVGKNKKDKTTAASGKNAAKNDKKKVAAAPKVEDILPLSQVKNIYSNIGKSNDKENRKPVEKEVKAKEAVRKPVKKAELPKAKPPKNIESALTLITVDDFKSCLEISKKRFPETPLLWLKDLSAFLNQKIAVELNDPVFSTKPDSYPLTSVPIGIKQIMDRAVHDAGKPTAALFYEITLTAMANDMSKGLPAIGHKIWLQFLAQTPQICVANTEKHHTLWTSYQNRQPIGLSILWALGQGGNKDFETGLKAFKEFMLPVLEKKNYSKFVVKYLSQLLKRNENNAISIDNFNFILDFACSYRNLPTDAHADYNCLNKKLKAIMFAKDGVKNVYFESLLKKFSGPQIFTVRVDLCDMLFKCLQKDATCWALWKQLYAKNYKESLVLLKYISDHWKKISVVIDKKLLKNFLKRISAINTDLLISSKNDTALQESTKIAKALLDKMTVKKTFPWKSLIFVVILAGGALLAMDFNKNGSWNQTQSARALKEMGVCGYVEKALITAHQGFNWTRQQIEGYAPGYLDAAGGHLQPYVELGRDLSLIAYNMGHKYVECAKEKAPLILEAIEKYAPGFLDQVQTGWQHIVAVSMDYGTRGYQYVTNEVFVGQLAPENMQKVLAETADATQKAAIDCYNWICDKIETTIQGK